MLSEDVITRQANFLHNPDRVLHMLRSQSALEVKEQHKAALWALSNRRWRHFARTRKIFISLQCEKCWG